MRRQVGRFRQERATAGASLLDLIVVLAVIAGVGILAVPAVRRYADANRLRAAGWTFARDLQVARQQAIQASRRQQVALSDRGVDPATGSPRAYSVGPPGAAGEGRWRELPAGVGFLEPAGSSVEFDPRGLAAGTLEFRLRTASSAPLVIRIRPTGRVEVGS